MGNSIEHNTKEYYQLQSEYWFNECCKCTNACNELINDMEEVKRKAEAFDEIVNAVDESANSYELVARIKIEVLKYQKLERGSDDNRN
ncbi:hypothetical protein BUZ33_03425 [Staphylococcus haemolyticus]|uniref:hypothetical protein n=2 Tax=Staphylococcus TaxID=1279 RepID=UPI000D1E17ED|nr:hypothetical protein [Staphylococcus haemolyticus]PTK56898.1 hypothetical protein BUZ33_03425 [Staphylococcus haemolyticus]